MRVASSATIWAKLRSDARLWVRGGSKPADSMSETRPFTSLPFPSDGQPVDLRLRSTAPDRQAA
ncbi:Uncharacterised protein [Rhodococcus gordoniae]|uniref:Uncharacterized protein n=1 Tax=Rhodococcus gordoniae TaxID=223392 RepID=A0A379M2J9_9NOCA|nr:Uncharacterised protein [Rhodococcus gordoniae]